MLTSVIHKTHKRAFVIVFTLSIVRWSRNLWVGQSYFNLLPASMSVIHTLLSLFSARSCIVFCWRHLLVKVQLDYLAYKKGTGIQAKCAGKPALLIGIRFAWRDHEFSKINFRSSQARLTFYLLLTVDIYVSINIDNIKKFWRHAYRTGLAISQSTWRFKSVISSYTTNDETRSKGQLQGGSMSWELQKLTDCTLARTENIL